MLRRKPWPNLEIVLMLVVGTASVLLSVGNRQTVNPFEQRYRLDAPSIAAFGSSCSAIVNEQGRRLLMLGKNGQITAIQPAKKGDSGGLDNIEGAAFSEDGTLFLLSFSRGATASSSQRVDLFSLGTCAEPPTLLGSQGFSDPRALFAAGQSTSTFALTAGSQGVSWLQWTDGGLTRIDYSTADKTEHSHVVLDWSTEGVRDAMLSGDTLLWIDLDGRLWSAMTGAPARVPLDRQSPDGSGRRWTRITKGPADSVILLEEGTGILFAMKDGYCEPWAPDLGAAGKNGVTWIQSGPGDSVVAVAGNEVSVMGAGSGNKTLSEVEFGPGIRFWSLMEYVLIIITTAGTLVILGKRFFRAIVQTVRAYRGATAFVLVTAVLVISAVAALFYGFSGKAVAQSQQSLEKLTTRTIAAFEDAASSRQSVKLADMGNLEFARMMSGILSGHGAGYPPNVEAILWQKSGADRPRVLASSAQHNANFALSDAELFALAKCFDGGSASSIENPKPDTTWISNYSRIDNFSLKDAVLELRWDTSQTERSSASLLVVMLFTVLCVLFAVGYLLRECASLIYQASQTRKDEATVPALVSQKYRQLYALLFYGISAGNLAVAVYGKIAGADLPVIGLGMGAVFLGGRFLARFLPLRPWTIFTFGAASAALFLVNGCTVPAMLFTTLAVSMARRVFSLPDPRDSGAFSRKMTTRGAIAGPLLGVTIGLTVFTLVTPQLGAGISIAGFAFIAFGSRNMGAIPASRTWKELINLGPLSRFIPILWLLFTLGKFGTREFGSDTLAAIFFMIVGPALLDFRLGSRLLDMRRESRQLLVGVISIMVPFFFWIAHARDVSSFIVFSWVIGVGSMLAAGLFPRTKKRTNPVGVLIFALCPVAIVLVHEAVALAAVGALLFVLAVLADRWYFVWRKP